MTRLTLFTATLVQDSALSVAGVDREGASDQPFALDVHGVPTLAGRGFKGAAVAMARRFFDPLPRSVSEAPDRTTALRRSAWEVSNATPATAPVVLRSRVGVGIRQKTGARAGGVLHDREVVPAGTRWPLELRVDWLHAGAEAAEVEGILGYVLSAHWAHGRCWLGSGAARGLGWCHIEELRAWRLDEDAYDQWVQGGRSPGRLPTPLAEVPTVPPTRSWCFRTLDVGIDLGEYRPAPDGPTWGLDMLAVGPHDAERAFQPMGNGRWARPSWANSGDVSDVLPTDRALLMDGDAPLLAGASVRGPLRHAFSRAARAAGRSVEDPHLVQGRVPADDPAGEVFGSVERSSQVLIRDAACEGEWAAARLHMHAEDEFSAGSYGSAKRDAVRLLRGRFPVRIVVEGPDVDTVDPLTRELDRLVALGALGHLPIGGHKTRGAGWGRWAPGTWCSDDVVKARSWAPSEEDTVAKTVPAPAPRQRARSAWTEWRDGTPRRGWLVVDRGRFEGQDLTLAQAAESARSALGEPLVAWWCEPAADLSLRIAPVTFGWAWPVDTALRVDEVCFFSGVACWRAARTVAGPRWVLLQEIAEPASGAREVSIHETPAYLHGDATRFAHAAGLERGRVVAREWRAGDEVLGFTLAKGRR